MPLMLKADQANTPEWEELRKKGIGGTDIANYITQRKSAKEIIGLKTGDIPPEEYSEKTLALFAYGHSREPELRAQAVKHFGLKFRKSGTYAHRDIPRYLANPDGLAKDAILEIKTTSGFTEAGKQWKRGAVPAHAWAQAHWYAYVTGRTKLCFTAEVDREVIHLGPYDLSEITMSAVQEAGEYLLRVWDGETPGEPERVEIDPPSEDVELLVEPWHELTGLIEKLTYLKANKSDLDAEIKTIEAAVKDLLGETTMVVNHAGEVLATYRWQERSSFDVASAKKAGINIDDFKKITKYRTLSIKKGK